MTITAEQIDAVLPRAATWPPKLYDLTDDDERRHACEWLARIYAQAVPSGPEGDETGPGVAQWPPPAKGTHESDLQRAPIVPHWSHAAATLPGEDSVAGRGGEREWLIAKAWSRS